MFRMTVGDIFFIKGRGLVATGTIEAGTLRVGDEVTINGGRAVTVSGIEAFRKVLDSANAGDNVGLLLRDIDKSDIKAGDVLSTDAFGSADPPAADPGARDRFRQMRDAGLMTDQQYEEAVRTLPPQ